MSKTVSHVIKLRHPIDRILEQGQVSACERGGTCEGACKGACDFCCILEPSDCTTPLGLPLLHPSPSLLLSSIASLACNFILLSLRRPYTSPRDRMAHGTRFDRLEVRFGVGRRFFDNAGREVYRSRNGCSVHILKNETNRWIGSRSVFGA